MRVSFQTFRLRIWRKASRLIPSAAAPISPPWSSRTRRGGGRGRRRADQPKMDIVDYIELT